MKTETFSAVDAAWLHMDKPANLAVIEGVMMFDAPLDFDRFRGVVADRLLIYDRFKQRVKPVLIQLGLPQWEPDPDFDLDYHIQRLTLPAPGDEAALQQLAGDLMSVRLDPKRPLWRMYFVDNYGSGTAIIGRLHHCIADGIALIQVLLSMTDPAPDAVWQPPHAAEAEGTHHPADLLAPVTKAINTTVATTENLLHEGLLTLAHPSRLIDAAKVGALGAIALSKLVLINPDRKTLFKGQCGLPKRATWSAPLSLLDVKTVAHALHGTVNDVLLAAVTGALRRYIEGKDGAVAGLNMRAMVPVSIRPPDKFHQLGNQFGLVILSLPVGLRDPIERIVTLKQRMDEIKDSPEAMVAFGILGGMGLSPVQVEDIIVRIFATKASAVMTNVPGPREPIYLVGQPMKRIMFWVPQPANLSLGVSIISYAGEVVVGIATDATLVPDPENIVAAFAEEFAHLKAWVTPGDLPQRAPHPKQAVPVQAVAARACQGVTKAGRACKNRALSQSEFCRLHQP